MNDIFLPVDLIKNIIYKEKKIKKIRELKGIIAYDKSVSNINLIKMNKYEKNIFVE